MLAHRLLVSEAMLARGLGNVGDSRRMERFLHKLLAGDEPTCKCRITRCPWFDNLFHIINFQFLCSPLITNGICNVEDNKS